MGLAWVFDLSASTEEFDMVSSDSKISSSYESDELDSSFSSKITVPLLELNCDKIELVELPSLEFLALVGELAASWT